jgi:sugar phosphate isomerase/epimerase
MEVLGMKNKEIEKILVKFVESGWDLIAVPSRKYLDGTGDLDELREAVRQADAECGSCGCLFDELYKKALVLLENE